LSKEEYMTLQRRFYGVSLDLKGHSTSSKLSLQHSSDEGATYSNAVEKILKASYDWYVWDFLKTSRKLRFKFSDATAGQSFSMRFYGLMQKEGERV